MNIKTENLTILFVDIAGFTATTSRQSRAENAHLLQTFDSTLLPLIKRFKGIVVKSIGDALLITFRSPTDAMLCSMALQDAMHEYNLNAPEEKRIQIRVAANLGEVRVTKNDIFGEPVNVASRIEGVAPADEIYLSEAVYMAMNKAEVPAQEVGFKELKGIPQPIRLYSIPRFAIPRLIPESVAASGEQGNELLFPYGGMHHRMPQSSSSRPVLSFFGGIPKYVMYIIAVISVVFGGIVLYRAISNGIKDATVSTPSDSSVIETKKSGVSGTTGKTEHVKWSVASVKSAYKAERISKAEYKRIVQNLKENYKNKIRNLKQDYRADKISRDVYENEVRKAKREYAGN
ncbi:MAG: adenylate/guanylate cyclase domain-containing protein [Desulfobacteraceae bacterium]|nr:MAG: adenylate/guanylate cyclase domain-containing protein [Desulfobacteraceae bacterium]